MNKPAHVVGGWALFNAVLITVLVIYGEDLLFVAMYTGPVLATLLAALLVLRVRRTPVGARQHRVAATSLSTAFAGLAAFLVGLGFIYGYWLYVLGAVALLLAVVRARREQLPAGTVTAPTEVPTLHTTVSESASRHDGGGKGATAARAATVAVIATRVLSAVRRGRKGPRP